MMKYKGYTATVEYDPSVNLLHGRVDNIQGVISFSANSTEDLQREFEASVDDYLAFCEEQNVEPEKPYSGRLLLRVDPGVHRAIAIAAKHKRQSINSWVTCAVMKEVNWANGQFAEVPQKPVIELDVLGKALQDLVEHYGKNPVYREFSAEVTHNPYDAVMRSSVGQRHRRNERA